MSTYFVSRHPGALLWAQAEGLPIDEVLRHLDVGCIRAGDTVIGTLPVHLACAVCDAGARLLYLVLALPAEARGRELGLEDMYRYGAELVEYRVSRVEAA